MHNISDNMKLSDNKYLYVVTIVKYMWPNFRKRFCTEETYSRPILNKLRNLNLQSLRFHFFCCCFFGVKALHAFIIISVKTIICKICNLILAGFNKIISSEIWRPISVPFDFYNKINLMIACDFSDSSFFKIGN